ncbi:hypothetical protein GT030_15385 [Streptomyces sp. SID1328]|uniref:hypothetical protein n=1 Tax=Streptomyces sp. SID1328 TaxID=2690250 RepID=UPI00136D8A6C|nr:hypothetical protein [Streptomyces sp. SID1328]MYV40208.1 hypothetical protein [Streptomyces sp. SID1328]
MTKRQFLGPIVAVALLASVTACAGAGAGHPAPAATATASASASASPRPQPVTAVMMDLIGGNAGRAAEQMGPDTEVAFKDMSGKGRSVDEPAGWKICETRPGPNQQITGYPVVLGVVRVGESCE